MLAAGCSQSSTGFVACPYSPDVALLPTMMLYPIPGATSVPDEVGIVIYAGYSGAAAFPPLDPASTYTVTFTSGRSNPCENAKTSLGSFSTQ